MGYRLTRSPREEAKELILKRDGLEREIEALLEVLQEPNGPGVRGNLVDSDGFPRSDIDIVTVLSQRNRLAKLTTDRALLTDQIENMLHTVLAKPAGDGPDGDTVSVVSHFAENGRRASASAATEDSGHRGAESMNADVAGAQVARTRPRRKPFAVIDEVSDGSPAKAAGLQIGDRIVVFGAISLQSIGTVSAAMGALPSLLHEHRNREVDLQVHRPRAPPSTDIEVVDVKLIPQEWRGRGLLGCHIVPAPVSQDQNFAPDVATATVRHTVNS